MKFFVQSFLFFFISTISKAQAPVDISKHYAMPRAIEKKFSASLLDTLVEICNNGIDDDGNGLIDRNDYACYFSNALPDTCIPTKMVWATLWDQLYWVDLETNNNWRVNFPTGEAYGDITWTPYGKLYGANGITGQIREIDPVTGETQFVTDVPGHDLTNGMTADAASNLYLCSRTTNGIWSIVKMDLTTGQSTIVVNLSSYGLNSAGDLTFLNGYLYVSCENSKIAKINIANGNLQIMNYTGPAYSSGFGLITLGDGYLYLSSSDEIFRIDPFTWESTNYYTLPTPGVINGLTSYTEFCNTVACKAKVNIVNETLLPYCSYTGVKLKSIGTGINGASGFTWTLPDGSKQNTDTLTAFSSGKYYLSYHSLPDTCGSIDSITLNIVKYPAVSLGKDTIVCTASQTVLHPINAEAGLFYKWQDGSVSLNYTVTQPGIYWIDASNVCGVKRDSILISPATAPKVNLGIDLTPCPGTSTILRNTLNKQSNESYRWSAGSTADSIIISQPGTYWLQSNNVCGTTRDTITISLKDSCICEPLFALANIGRDGEICQYDTLVLKSNFHKNGFRYRWQDGSSNNSYTVSKPGIYWVDVTTYCNTVRDTVIVNKKGNCECYVNLPNAFTPNNDGKNDIWKPNCDCTIYGELKIYDRYGVLVYHTTDLKKGWNGNYKGIMQTTGSYVYYINYKVQNRPNINTKKGSFILIN